MEPEILPLFLILVFSFNLQEITWKNNWTFCFFKDLKLSQLCFGLFSVTYRIEYTQVSNNTLLRIGTENTEEKENSYSNYCDVHGLLLLWFSAFSF